MTTNFHDFFCQSVFVRFRNPKCLYCRYLLILLPPDLLLSALPRFSWMTSFRKRVAYLWFSVPLKILLKIGSFRSKISFGCCVSCLLFRELNWLRVFGMLLVSLTVSDNYCNMSNANPQRELRELNNQRQWWRAITNIESCCGRELSGELHRAEWEK